MAFYHTGSDSQRSKRSARLIDPSKTLTFFFPTFLPIYFELPEGVSPRHNKRQVPCALITCEV